MIQSNSVETIRNQIKEIILLEKNADMFFNDIVEPFVNDFFEQRFLRQGKLEDDFLDERYKSKRGMLCALCAYRSLQAQREETSEMLRYITLVKLIQFMRFSDDEFVKFVNQNSASVANDAIKNYLNLNNNELVREIERLFLEDTNIYLVSRPNSAHWLLEFLEQTWSEGTIDKNDETKIVNIWFKLMTSRFIHIRSSETEREDFSRSISYFIGAHGGRFLTDTESYAKYLQQTGDLENILFNKQVNFIKLMDIDCKLAKIYRRFISDENLKVRFARDAVWADHNKSLFVKVLSSIKYYCLSKWVALFVDRFITRKGNINPNLDVGLDQKKENMEPIKESNQDKKTTITEPEHKNDNDQQTI